MSLWPMGRANPAVSDVKYLDAMDTGATELLHLLSWHSSDTSLNLVFPLGRRRRAG